MVFVHGIGGSIRSFLPIIEGLDRSKYKPWFFFYPSGADLEQLAEFFYQLYLSGDVIPQSKMPMIVVAHSMGGFDVELSDQYSPITQYFIHTIGKYLVLMAKGYISPVNAAQSHFISVLNKEELPMSEEEKGIVMFMQNYPDLINAFLLNNVAGLN